MNNKEIMLTDQSLENRDSLVKWLYNFHNKVNESTGSLYNISLDDLKNRYEKFRAVCDMTEIMKHDAFIEATQKEAPYITTDDAIFFKNYPICGKSF